MPPRIQQRELCILSTVSLLGGRPPGFCMARRAAGWRKPIGAVSVVRGTRWGNPYRVGVHAVDNAEAARLFIDYLGRHPELVADARIMLSGKALMCWCRPEQPCHADVWLRVVNP
jgi:hypothetical protein